MANALASLFMDALVGLELGATGRDASNRLSVEGLTVTPKAGGAVVIGIVKVEAVAMRLVSGPLVVEVGRLVLRGLSGEVRIEQDRPRLRFLETAEAELTGVKLQGPLALSQGARSGQDASHVTTRAGTSGHGTTGQDTGAWRVGPLAAADGTIRAKIVDAHLMFDADVTVPIRDGRIDFNAATVEHVGPDSSMGVSRLGLYVDAPNGRSYIYQFSCTPVAGVEFERRNALLGAWVTDRGNLRLQPFIEGLLRQGPRRPGDCFTEQARALFQRTALSGEVQLGDGRFAAPGVEADLAGRGEGRNVIQLHSEVVGRGVTAELPSLSVRRAAFNANDMRATCDAITGALRLRLDVEDGDLRFTLELANMKISRLRVEPLGANGRG